MEYTRLNWQPTYDNYYYIKILDLDLMIIPWDGKKVGWKDSDFHLMIIPWDGKKMERQPVHMWLTITRG